MPIITCYQCRGPVEVRDFKYFPEKCPRCYHSNEFIIVNNATPADVMKYVGGEIIDGVFYAPEYPEIKNGLECRLEQPEGEQRVQIVAKKV